MNISLDYLSFDFLVSVTYTPRVDDATFGGPTNINNCLFWREKKDFVEGDVEFRRNHSGLNIWINETTIVPSRGDQVVVEGLTFIVETVEIDWDKAQCYRIRMYNDTSVG